MSAHVGARDGDAPDPRTLAATGAALLAFASNSILCRGALAPDAIDAASFTLVRVGAGALALLALLRARGRDAAARRPAGSWGSAAALFVYALAFSYAYGSLDAGTGALILFGCVQATMILWGARGGERLARRELAALVIALGGLVYLVSPGLTAPPLVGSLRMAVAGVAWGVYSLRGRGAAAPIAATTGNFLRAVPLAVVAAALAAPRVHVQPLGLGLAAVSGALTSGVGYVLWYAALRGLTAARAAIVQLAVPVLAAFLGVAFLSERVTGRLVLASALVLGGVGLAVTRRR